MTLTKTNTRKKSHSRTNPILSACASVFNGLSPGSRPTPSHSISGSGSAVWVILLKDRQTAQKKKITWSMSLLRNHVNCSCVSSYSEHRVRWRIKKSWNWLGVLRYLELLSYSSSCPLTASILVCFLSGCPDRLCGFPLSHYLHTHSWFCGRNARMSACLVSSSDATKRCAKQLLQNLRNM